MDGLEINGLEEPVDNPQTILSKEEKIDLEKLLEAIKEDPKPIIEMAEDISPNPKEIIEECELMNTSSQKTNRGIISLNGILKKEYPIPKKPSKEVIDFCCYETSVE